MKYQTKLYLSFLLLSLACSILGLIIDYSQAKKSYINEFRSHVMSISATTATLIDRNELQGAIASNLSSSADYSMIERSLSNVRKRNTRADVSVVNCYILRPSETNPSQMKILFSTESGNSTIKENLYISSFSKDLNNYLNTTYSPEEFIVDRNGTWLSGFSPIFDDKGAYLATVGVDISSNEVKHDLIILIKIGFIALFSSLLIAFFFARHYSKKISSSIKKLVVLTKKISEGDMKYQADIERTDQASEVAEAIYQMCNGLSERERLRTNFARYVSSSLLEEVLSSGNPPKLEGERRKITVLVSDIRQFTHLSEKMPPEKVLELLNEYFEKMIEVIFEHHGALDKFLGDGLIVIFGSMIDDEKQEMHAIDAAVEMQKTLALLGDEWERSSRPRLKIGIGIHTGLAVVGNVGSEQRMEFTAIGDTVLIASLLQDATKKLKLPILISESTAAAFEKTSPLPSIGSLPIPGREQSIRIYTVEI